MNNQEYSPYQTTNGLHESDTNGHVPSQDLFAEEEATTGKSVKLL